MGCAQSKNVIRVHEVQIYSRGETSHQNWTRKCEKNPGHKGYVPVRDFKLQHLPDKYRDKDILELIQTLSQLTVKISARWVSASRPEHYPEDKIAYPFHKKRAVPRSGTGRICRVSKHGSVPDEPCPCRCCQNTSSPEVSWGEIFVVTATHVIYDHEETTDVSCFLNYDSQDERYRRLDDANFIESEITDDKCWLRFFTHDSQLTDEIVAKVSRYDQLCELLHAKYKQKDTTLQEENRFAVVVSHPHGTYKMVSTGEWTQRALMDKYYTQYTYNAMTCPGTSGATVYTLSMPGWFYVHTHSGAKPDGGFSGYGFEH